MCVMPSASAETSNLRCVRAGSNWLSSAELSRTGDTRGRCDHDYILDAVLDLAEASELPSPAGTAYLFSVGEKESLGTMRQGVMFTYTPRLVS